MWQKSVLDSIRSFYVNTDTECNPQFVTIESVDAVIVSEVSRRLQKNSRNLQLNDTGNVTNVTTPTLAPTFSPEDSIQSSETPSVVLFVSGVCNECPSDLALTDDVSGRRRLQDLFQQLPPARSNCYCQLGAIEETRLPRAQEVSEDLNSELKERNSTLAVQQIQEVAVADCRQETVSFRSGDRLRLYFDPSASNSILVRVAEIIRRSYNDLADEFCDPLIRRITDVEILSSTRVGSGNNGCAEFDVQFSTVGTCRGCKDGTPLFSNSEGSRRLQQEKVSEFSNNKRRDRSGRTKPGRFPRRLQGDSECFCSPNSRGPRAATKSEFLSEFESELDDVGLSFVCGTSDDKPPPNKEPDDSKPFNDDPDKKPPDDGSDKNPNGPQQQQPGPNQPGPVPPQQQQPGPNQPGPVPPQQQQPGPNQPGPVPPPSEPDKDNPPPPPPPEPDEDNPPPPPPPEPEEDNPPPPPPPEPDEEPPPPPPPEPAPEPEPAPPPPPPGGGPPPPPGRIRRGLGRTE